MLGRLRTTGLEKDSVVHPLVPWEEELFRKGMKKVVWLPLSLGGGHRGLVLLEALGQEEP